ncbi:TPA: surface exclusion protein SEA1/PrgA, partial [Enterococcus faecalis]
MKKFASAGLSILVATGVAGIGGNEVQAAEQAQPKTPENSSTEQPAVKATQTTEQAITEKQQQVAQQQGVVDQKQQVADTAKKEKDTIDQSVKEQQAVVDQNKDTLDQSQQAVTDQQAVVDEAKKVVDEATPSAIEKAKEQVATDTQAVDDQQKVVDQAQTDVNQQQAVVDEKAKETTAAKVQNEKDQQAVTAAKKEQAKLEELAKNAEAEKAKAEKEQAAKEAELANKQKEEAKAKDQKTKDDQAVADQQTVVTTSQEKVADAKADTAAKQADLTAKENALKDKQAATKQAQNTLDNSKEELKGHKGINLPPKFSADYDTKLSAEEIATLEKTALEMNKNFPTSKEDEKNKDVMWDIQHLSADQKKELSVYTTELLNDVRKKLGLSQLSVSDQSIKFAWDVAKYSDTGEYMHDVTAINKAAKENGFKEYPGMNYYENLGGGYYETENGKVSKYTLQESIRKMLVNMLFDDGRLGYSHLHSLLQDGKTALGVSLSGEKNSISPKIHIISYGKEKLEDSSQYQNGEVASIKSKEELQQEIASNQEKLATAQQAESDAQQARSASQQALNTAKTTQATAEKELSVHKATLANLQAVATKSTTNYEEKVRQTATAETSLQQTKDQLATINELIQNRAAVLEKAKTTVAEAQA